MDNEKYGIELELITNKFNQKIQQVKSEVRSIDNVKKVDFSFDAPASVWRQKIQEINAQGKAVDKLKVKYDDLKMAASTLGTSFNKGLDRMTSKIKRFGLSLLSIRSIYSLVSRASSAYLSQDTELANKLQSAWIGLGAIFAPIIEKIVDLVTKAVRYIGIFVKALTGVDLLARATAKSMGGTAKAAKSLNKALAGFDELQNLDTDAGGGANDIGAGLGSLEDVEIDTKWADRIQKFAIWFKKNWGTVLSGLAGTYSAIKLITLGVGKIKALGIGFLIGGIIYSVTSLIKYLKDPSWKNFGKIITGIGIALSGLAVIIGSVPLAVAAAVTAITGLVISHWDKIRTFLQSGIDWLRSKTDWVREYFGIVGEFIYTKWLNFIQGILTAFDVMFKTIKYIFDGIIAFIRGDFKISWNNIWEDLKKVFFNMWDKIKGKVKNTWDAILGFFAKGGKIFEGVKDGIANVFKTIVNSMLRGINKVIAIPFNQINAVLNKIKGVNIFGIKPFDSFWNYNPIPVPQIPQLAIGTNFVPEDQLAMLHKGEAVVPKKFNSKEYFGNNDETSAKLDEVISAIREIEINPYTTIRDVGKASLSYINNKSRQLGESVVV